MGDDEWMGRAACKGAPTEAFFPEPGGAAQAAMLHAQRTWCDGCPVRQDCFNWAVERGEQGIWAGTSERERKRAVGLPPNARVVPSRQCAVCCRWFRPSKEHVVGCSEACQLEYRRQRVAEYNAERSRRAAYDGRRRVGAR